MFRIGPIDQHSIFDAPRIAASTSGFDAYGCATAEVAAATAALHSCAGINNATDGVVWHSRRRGGGGRHQRWLGEA